MDEINIYVRLTTDNQWIPSYWGVMLWALTGRIQRFIVSTISTHNYDTWWHHEMETFAALLAICAGN